MVSLLRNGVRNISGGERYNQSGDREREGKYFLHLGYFLLCHSGGVSRFEIFSKASVRVMNRRETYSDVIGSVLRAGRYTSGTMLH